MDPHQCYSVPTQEILVPVYETLLRYDKDDPEGLIPCLAESYEISENGYIYIFHLRDDVTFHDGTPFTAEDVLYSYERLLTLYFGPGWLLEPINIEASSAIDPYTLNITLHHPYAPFIYTVASQWGALIVNSELVKSHATAEDPWAHEWLKENMDGTGSGPYMLEEWVPEDHVTLVKNPDYWGGWDKPHVDKIYMPLIDESATRRLRLEEGTLDIGLLTLEDALAVEDKEGINVEIVPGLTNYFIYMNTQKPPLNNKLIRHALSYMYDYEGMIEAVRHGLGTQALGPIPRSLWGWNPDAKQFTYNLTKAEELIREAGYEPEDIKLDYWYMEAPEPRRIAEILQAGAAEIGVEITLHGTTWAILSETAHPGSHDVNDGPDLSALYWWPDYADPQAFVEPLLVSYVDEPTTNTSDYGYYNWAYYCNAEVNRLLDEAVIETNVSKRVEIYHQMQEIICEDAPAIWVFDSLNTISYRDWVKGYYFNPLYTGCTDFYNIYIEGR